MWCYKMSFDVSWRYVMWACWTYHVMWCDVALCDTMLHYVIKCHVILCDVMSCEVIWCEAPARICHSFSSMYNSHDSHKKSKILERLYGSLLNELHKCSNILDFYERHDCCTVDLLPCLGRLALMIWIVMWYGVDRGLLAIFIFSSVWVSEEKVNVGCSLCSPAYLITLHVSCNVNWCGVMWYNVALCYQMSSHVMWGHFMWRYVMWGCVTLLNVITYHVMS